MPQGIVDADGASGTERRYRLVDKPDDDVGYCRTALYSP
jgi:hypothetical protein